MADTFAVRHALPPGDPIDMVALRRYRLHRVRDEMAQRSIEACVLVGPVSIRYACGARNMQVFHLRNPARSLVVPVEGPVVLFELTGCMHLAEGRETVGEIRPSVTASYVAAGGGVAGAERAWAHQAGGEVRRHCGPADRRRRAGERRCGSCAGRVWLALGGCSSAARARTLG